MHDFFASSVFFDVFVSLAAYFIGMALRRKTGLSIVIAGVFTVACAPVFAMLL